jgi:hypothetical protein
MNRRELLAGAGALTIAGCGAPTQGQQAAGVAGGGGPVALKGDPFAGASLMSDVETYVGFGTHRTGSEGDIATSEWFAKRWTELGYQIEQTAFPTPNADTTVARFEAGGQAIDGFAQPPLSFTPAGGIMAPLARWNPKSIGDVSGSIAVVHLPRQPGTPALGGGYREAFEGAAKAGAVGVIGVISAPSGEVVAINTPSEMYLETPVLCVGEKEKARIDAAIASKQPAKLTILGPGGFRNGRNTIARRGTAGPWVIISTPQSGWFTCGGERGPGIAMSLALSGWAAAQSFPCRFLFIATSGHEWADAGAHIFHQGQAPDPKETALWFHLGASYGARGYEETAAGLNPLETPNLVRTLMASADLLPACQTAFAGQPVIEQPAVADASRALGELALVLREGYPSSAGFWGAHGLFHTPVDGKDATSGAIMEPIARAVAKVIEGKLARI